MSIYGFEVTHEDIQNLELSENLVFEQKRSQILKSLQTIDVQACPGSGKTTLIAAKLMLLAKKWRYAHRGVCVLSHTNVAKNEIIEKLKNSRIAEAQTLLLYPHFIGTIQEFINKFLGLPYLRSCGIDVKLIDTDQCTELIYSRLGFRTRSYIDRKNANQQQNVLYDFGLKIIDALIDVDVPTFPNGSTSDSYNDLRKTRFDLIDEGYCFYSDMYVFAEKILIDNSDSIIALQKRFPLIFLDEMQDTQKFQDDLLQRIFPLTADNISVQRFGDPDQAIFNGINQDQPNESYNLKPRTDFDFVIDQSHRFDNSIGDKIRGLSYNSVVLATELSKNILEDRKSYHVNGTCFEHTIFVYDDQSVETVIPEFVALLLQQFNLQKISKDSLTVKAVGAIGKDIEKSTQHRISSYWKSYTKNQSTKSFKEETLFDAVLYCRQHSEEHWSSHYRRLNSCILKILRLLKQKDSEDKWYTQSSLRDFLKKQGWWKSYQELMYWFLNNTDAISADIWGQKIGILKLILDIVSVSETVESYLNYESTALPTRLAEESSNTNRHDIQGVKIEIATIHSVKGETHDATLILETKFDRWFDVQEMIVFLTSYSQTRPEYDASKPRSKNYILMRFMRQLYVAMSRPRYLLCFAIHKDRISLDQEKSLESQGWHIQKLRVTS